MADEAIANAEAALGEFDDKLRAVDTEMETATEHRNRADQAVEVCQREKEQIEEDVKKETKDAHEAQVCKRSKSNLRCGSIANAS